MDHHQAEPLSQNSDSTIDRIIDAGEVLFAENGYEGTTLRQIAQRVGIKEPSIYAHFAGKEAVYGAVIDRALRPFHAEMDSWIKTEMTLRDLFEIPRKLLLLHARHPYAARIMHREFCLPADRISPKVMEWLEQIAQQSRVFMGELHDPEAAPLDPSRVVVHIVTLTNITLGFFSTQGMQARLLGDDYDDARLFDEYVHILARIFRGLLV